MAGRDGLSEGDRALLKKLADAWETSLKKQAEPRPFFERYATPVAVLVSALAVMVTIWYSQRQLTQSSDQFEKSQRTSDAQFDRTTRAGQFADIVDGLASSSVAVQVNSIRRLVQYVVEPSNFESTDRQTQAAVNAAQTLEAFIEDESQHPGHEGLTSYRDPQPVVVGRAVDQLVRLTGAVEADADIETFPQADVELTRGNFHGAGVAAFVPQGSFLAVAADFRAATVTDWDLTQVAAPKLNSAFFTCANLQKSDLGTANVAGADFTGANLRGADLSEVQNLTRAQIRGALVGPATRLPDHMKRYAKGWGVVEDDGEFLPSPACRHLMDRMTDLLPGSGYSSRLPCPGTASSPWEVRLSENESQALGRVCRLRTVLNKTNGQATHLLRGH